MFIARCLNVQYYPKGHQSGNESVEILQQFVEWSALCSVNILDREQAAKLEFNTGRIAAWECECYW